MRKRLHHEPPVLYYSDQSTYFVTVCTAERGRNVLCHPQLGQAIRESIAFRNEKKIWYCSIAVLMPDHVHLILNVPDEKPLAEAVGDWKRYIAHGHGIVWQRNFFDHRIRAGENFGQKAEYVFENPVRGGLIEKAEDWPYSWIADRDAVR